VSWLARREAERHIARMTDPVAGTLRVTSASYPPTGVNATYSNYHLAGVVQAAGLAPTAVEHSGLARVAKWPQPGSDLPVTVDRVRPDRPWSYPTRAAGAHCDLPELIHHARRAGQGRDHRRHGQAAH
jgi:hypothetical protein